MTDSITFSRPFSATYRTTGRGGNAITGTFETDRLVLPPQRPPMAQVSRLSENDVGGPEVTRHLSTLHPDVRPNFAMAMADIKRAGIAITFPNGNMSGYRSSAQQAGIDPRHTGAEAGTSFHNHGLALDVTPANPRDHARLRDIMRQHGFFNGDDVTTVNGQTHYATRMMQFQGARDPHHYQTSPRWQDAYTLQALPRVTVDGREYPLIPGGELWRAKATPEHAAQVRDRLGITVDSSGNITRTPVTIGTRSDTQPATPGTAPQPAAQSAPPPAQSAAPQAPAAGTAPQPPAPAATPPASGTAPAARPAAPAPTAPAAAVPVPPVRPSMPMPDGLVARPSGRTTPEQRAERHTENGLRVLGITNGNMSPEERATALRTYAAGAGLPENATPAQIREQVGKDIRALQERLRDANNADATKGHYDLGRFGQNGVDGIAGAYTQGALRRFEQENPGQTALSLIGRPNSAVAAAPAQGTTPPSPPAAATPAPAAAAPATPPAAATPAPAAATPPAAPSATTPATPAPSAASTTTPATPPAGTTTPRAAITPEEAAQANMSAGEFLTRRAQEGAAKPQSPSQGTPASDLPPLPDNFSSLSPDMQRSLTQFSQNHRVESSLEVARANLDSVNAGNIPGKKPGQAADTQIG